MTILLIAVGVMGQSELAADIAIVQGATLAVFFAFSANARSIILGESSKISWLQILRSRVLLMAPLGGGALVICLYLTEATPLLALKHSLSHALYGPGRFPISTPSKLVELAPARGVGARPSGKGR